MRRKAISKGFLFAVCFCIPMLISGQSNAIVEIIHNASPSFGYITVGPAGRDFYLKVNGKMRGADSADYISGAQEGSYTIIGDGDPREVSVEATNIVTSPELNLTYIKCKYDAEQLRTCSNNARTFPSPPVEGVPLSIGIRVTTATEITQNSTASVSYEILVLYI